MALASARRRLGATILTGIVLSCSGCGSAGTDEAPPRAGAPETAPEPEAPATELVLYVLSDGLALARPRAGAEPVLRLDEGERLRWFSRKDDWFRLAETPTDVEAWVRADQVRQAEERRQPASETQRKAIENELHRMGGDRWVSHVVIFHETETVLGITVSVSNSAAQGDDCPRLAALAERLAPGYRLEATVYDGRGSRVCGT